MPTGLGESALRTLAGSTRAATGSMCAIQGSTYLSIGGSVFQVSPSGPSDK